MTTTDQHTVLVVDDHPLFRRGVKELLSLEPSISVVGEAGGREDALRLAREFEPDLIVLDLNIKGASGVEILAALKEEDPSRRVVILTVSDAAEDLSACIRAGADGYFLKDSEPEQFLAAICQTLEGRTVVDPTMICQLTEMVRAQTPAAAPRPAPAALTEREEEVLELIVQGFTNKLIARKLEISDGTVKGHVKHLLKKIGCKSRVEAAVWAANRARS